MRGLRSRCRGSTGGVRERAGEAVNWFREEGCVMIKCSCPADKTENGRPLLCWCLARVPCDVEDALNPESIYAVCCGAYRYEVLQGGGDRLLRRLIHTTYGDNMLLLGWWSAFK